MRQFEDIVSKHKTILLLSGGMDSLLITALAHDRGDDLYALFFDYGQKTNKKEKQCFNKICDHYKIGQESRTILELDALKKIGGSSLTDSDINVEVELEKKSIPNSYVPFRNTIFLSFATSYAETINGNSLMIGAVLEDALGYPDCRPEYYATYNNLIRVASTCDSLKVETPIIRMTKAQILNKCLELKAPLELSWSCYQSETTPCNECDSCLLRAKAFAEIEAIDPLS